MRTLLLALVTVLLAGCAHAAGEAPKPASPLTTGGPFGTVTGAFGQSPEVSFPSGSRPSGTLQRSILIPGSGPAVAIGDLVVTDYLGRLWGGVTFDDSYRRGLAETLQVGLGKLLPGLDDGLVGVPVGSRVELTVPPADGYGSKGNAALGISGTDTLVYVFDIAQRYNGKSSADRDGTPVTTPAELPKVTGSLGAAPLITFPKRAVLPRHRVTYPVARGRGAPLRSGTAVLQYYSVNWRGEFLDSTWLNGTPTALPVGSAESATGGIFDGLVGLPVGSRVLIVVPAAAGAKQALNTAVIAVDVLAQVSTAKQMRGQPGR